MFRPIHLVVRDQAQIATRRHHQGVLAVAHTPIEQIATDVANRNATNSLRDASRADASQTSRLAGARRAADAKEARSAEAAKASQDDIDMKPALIEARPTPAIDAAGAQKALDQVKTRMRRDPEFIMAAHSHLTSEDALQLFE